MVRCQRSAAASGLIVVSALLVTSAANAADFDALGNYQPALDAIVSDGFEDGVTRYVPDFVGDDCSYVQFYEIDSEDALEGSRLLELRTADWCSERFELSLPSWPGSYVATLWMRHGALDAQVSIKYPDQPERDGLAAKMFPTGRTTSDGWVELSTNEFPVDGAKVERAYLVVSGYGAVGVEIDALEIRPSGAFVPQRACAGAGDPVCTDEEICFYNRCLLGRLSVPPLPLEGMRDDVVDELQSQLRVFYGGRKTRLQDLPLALATLDSIRHATTAWEFWNGWALAIRQLHDWHTHTSGGAVDGFSSTRRLNVCFIEGDADTSKASWPGHPEYQDILVSHTGTEGNQGIHQGDRLVAVDGQHPIDWARSLIGIDWGHWRACDDAVFTEHVERMRGLILRFATEFTILHCDSASESCDAVPRTYRVAELPESSGGDVNCDHRPFYHLEGDNNPGPNHQVGGQFFRGRVQNTTEQEAIYGLIWDALWGSEHVHDELEAAIVDFKANARGVILDHRQSPGGTTDVPPVLSRLVRPTEPLLVLLSPIPVAGMDGPESIADGLSLFDRYQSSSLTIEVGDADHDPDLPVALILHRNGSASDFFASCMQGAPKVRIFGHSGIAGGYSTFYEFFYYGGLGLKLASGDTIHADGRPLIGDAVEPDEIVLLKQSDLLAGRDTLHEAALAWVRQELKP
ncbi:MAG: hypothetical protein JRI23_31895 [Deltaproteobacteria bacterium]|nr:hypothetical protein [Deltaproteobacteria bacterium]MBW2536827.1 hypothetical protein [Deltaproteobacteria bacterium]